LGKNSLLKRRLVALLETATGTAHDRLAVRHFPEVEGKMEPARRKPRGRDHQRLRVSLGKGVGLAGISTVAVGLWVYFKAHGVGLDLSSHLVVALGGLVSVMGSMLLSSTMVEFRTAIHLSYVSLMLGSLFVFLPLAFGWESVAVPLMIVGSVILMGSLVLSLLEFFVCRLWRVDGGRKSYTSGD
jgi:hypothetical protein